MKSFHNIRCEVCNKFITTDRPVRALPKEANNEG